MEKIKKKFRRELVASFFWIFIGYGIGFAVSDFQSMEIDKCVQNSLKCTKARAFLYEIKRDYLGRDKIVCSKFGTRKNAR